MKLCELQIIWNRFHYADRKRRFCNRLIYPKLKQTIKAKKQTDRQTNLWNSGTTNKEFQLVCWWMLAMYLKTLLAKVNIKYIVYKI